MKPATPLPWVFVDNGEGHTNCSYSVDGVMDDEPYENFAPTKDNAIFIVHAANAYPQLVAALRSALSASAGDWQKGQSWDRAATALLRELGEA